MNTIHSLSLYRIVMVAVPAVMFFSLHFYSKVPADVRLLIQKQTQIIKPAYAFQKASVHAEHLKNKSAPSSDVSQDDHPEFIPGIIILKFKADSPLAAVAAELFQKGERFASLTGSTALDELNHKYQVQKITKRDQVSRSIEEIKKKFPQRTKRIPPVAQVPDLGKTYILEFKDKHIDIPALCAQYAKDPHVQYAQPDYQMTIYK